MKWKGLGIILVGTQDKIKLDIFISGQWHVERLIDKHSEEKQQTGL